MSLQYAPVHPRSTPGDPEDAASASAVGLRHAAGELGASPAEVEAAVRLGLVRAVACTTSWEPRIPRAEIGRLRAGGGFTPALRRATRLVGATGAADLLAVSPARFTRLARGGCFRPLDFHVTRHRVIAWRYPAAELRAFAERNPGLLRGRAPDSLRRALRRGHDWRPLHWRSRRTAQLAGQAPDAWRRAAVHAAVLAPSALSTAVPDPRERLRLHRLLPPLARSCHGPGTGPVPEETPGFLFAVGALLTTTGPDEERHHRERLAIALAEARDPAARADRTALTTARRPSP
ncbi:DUF6397 family protein [Streptomyces sp. RFCAC02]|uniref:DUF6397 family protein n=1 Tax=Streptomyces sp. RFCAC02 TaxID=2499143 RepID=UPI0010205BD7|nr:DUF6397 family protein [Streptomyces sp. RFCAC02]